MRKQHRFKSFDIKAADLLYEDDDLIAVNKPAGLSSHATVDRSRPHLLGAVEAYVKACASGPVTIGLHHRLDVETSGVIVLTKSKRANKTLGEQFAEHRAQKTYWALSLAPRATRHWSVRNYLAPKKALQPDGRKRLMSQAVRSGGDLAETDFEVLELSRIRRFDERIAWMEARPRTGRMHQIRVHLAQSGSPILGDSLYAPASVAEMSPRLMLHARKIEITHPITSASMTIEAPLPDDFISVMKHWFDTSVTEGC